MLSQTVASSIVVEARKISDKQTMAIDFLDLEGNSKYNLKLKNFDNISNKENKEFECYEIILEKLNILASRVSDSVTIDSDDIKKKIDYDGDDDDFIKDTDYKSDGSSDGSSSDGSSSDGIEIDEENKDDLVGSFLTINHFHHIINDNVNY